MNYMNKDDKEILQISIGRVAVILFVVVLSLIILRHCLNVKGYDVITQLDSVEIECSKSFYPRGFYCY